ncbi:MAG: hypothetical protein ABFD96_03345 [Armatimonadia bacterium]
MNETKAIANYQRPQLTPSVWQMIQSVAPVMHRARLFGVTSPEQATAVLLKGYELGLGLAASFEYIHIIDGKPGLSPRGALALILSSPIYGGMKITEEVGKCTVWMKRADNGFEHTVTWTIQDARKAGVVKPDSGWEKYEPNMLRWRTIGFCADVVFPDVTGGMKRADEYGADLTPDGDVIEGSWSVAVERPTAASTASAPSVEAVSPTLTPLTLNDLVNRYGAEAIMGANEGRIPGTDDELQAVAVKLGVQNG